MKLHYTEINRYYDNGQLDEYCEKQGVSPSELVCSLLEHIDILESEIVDLENREECYED